MENVKIVYDSNGVKDEFDLMSDALQLSSR